MVRSNDIYHDTQINIYFFNIGKEAEEEVICMKCGTNLFDLRNAIRQPFYCSNQGTML